MKADDLVKYMADMFPYRRKSSRDWIGPVSVGLGLGIAVGVGLGCLVAPTTGEETRRRLRDSAGRLRHSAERAKDRALGAAHRARDELQESTSSITGERSFADEIGAR
ncbi:hypothetical protein SOCEGT47_079230 [Sorangium cellulosum]|jgi:gas vesicle protein|uniref:YtxH domain-containing protein n=1 Tax=Sorangium cellulosum TaxID=56 RepID=A0A4P2QDA3_SORCE|nr:YtxH domain-containing protein [Sorangium cellulosum]AUX27336.1 hypothetical protein SOCEGT47_079230 [Sorangium cellulosum]